jgi:hypothetical protein
LWWKLKAGISKYKVWKKFTGPKKGQFPETDAVFMVFQERCKMGIKCIVLFLWHV